MEGTTDVTLELRIVDGLLAGTARCGDASLEFAGWIGLISVLDALVPHVPAPPLRYREDAAATNSRTRREP